MTMHRQIDTSFQKPAIIIGKFPLYYIPKKKWLMIQICRKDKKKVYEAIRTGKIDAAEMSFPNLIDDILLTLKRRGLTDLLAQALPDKRRDNSHIPFDILLCLAVAARLKCKTSKTLHKYLSKTMLLTALPYKSI